jgi:hypothetical protein
MKSIANQYRDLKEGKMTQQNFMRNLRMSLPQFITNVTSFGDAVRILKNKSILTEVFSGSGTPDEDRPMKAAIPNWDRVKKRAEDPEYDFDKEEETSDDEIDAMVKKMEDEKAGEEAVKAQYDEELNEFGGQGDTPDNPKLQAAAKYLVQNRDRFLTQDYFFPHAISTLSLKSDKDLYDYVVNNWHSDGVYDTVAHMKSQMEESLNEAKKKEEKNYSVQQANPTELRLGIRTELEHGDMELDKAKEIAYKNIAKDPIYYTKLKLSGLEAHPKKVKGEKVAPAKKAKKESAQLVDLVNAMQKVKMPKVDEKKKLKENVDEKMRFQDLPADPEKYKIVRDSKNYIIKATNADGVEFQKGDTVKTYDGEEIKIVKFEESQGKVKAIYNKGMFFASIDIDGLEAPRPTMRPGVDMGASFEKMKKSMEEIIRETVSEYFDGRDNLVNPLSAEEENK